MAGRPGKDCAGSLEQLRRIEYRHVDAGDKAVAYSDLAKLAEAKSRGSTADTSLGEGPANVRLWISSDK